MHPETRYTSDARNRSSIRPGSDLLEVADPITVGINRQRIGASPHRLVIISNAVAVAVRGHGISPGEFLEVVSQTVGIGISVHILGHPDRRRDRPDRVVPTLHHANPTPRSEMRSHPQLRPNT
jgi:hypothetical protein